MDKTKKNRSGSISNEGRSGGDSNPRGKTQQPGAPAKSNRQTGGNKRHEKDDSSGTERMITRKGPNSI